MIKDLYDLIADSALGFKDNSIEENPLELYTILMPLEEFVAENIPKVDCEIDLLAPKLGEDRLEEYIIRKRLLAIARGDNPKAKKRAREILEQVYSLKLIP